MHNEAIIRYTETMKTKQGNALLHLKRAFPCNEESLSLKQRNALFEWKRYKPVGTDALVCLKYPTCIADRRGRLSLLCGIISDCKYQS